MLPRVPWGSAIRQAAACAAAVLCALPAAGGYYGYVASADGRGHWIHVLPVEGGVRTPRGELERRGAILPLMLDLRCRDGEVPVQARLSWPKHPLDPPAVRLVQRPLGWLWRVAAGGGVYRERLRVVLGQAAFEGVVGRRREALREETDYQLALPVRETVRQLRAAAGGPLRVELEGPRTSGGATYRIAPAFARWAERMLAGCGG